MQQDAEIQEYDIETTQVISWKIFISCIPYGQVTVTTTHSNSILQCGISL
jgi:hypothetical protein